jgi:hypothetical protein
MFELNEEEFGWADGWYAQLEQQIMIELKFRCILVTPVEVIQSLLTLAAKEKLLTPLRAEHARLLRVSSAISYLCLQSKLFSASNFI